VQVVQLERFWPSTCLGSSKFHSGSKCHCTFSLFSVQLCSLTSAKEFPEDPIRITFICNSFQFLCSVLCYYPM
jgi:hypothetical protein